MLLNCPWTAVDSSTGLVGAGALLAVCLCCPYPCLAGRRRLGGHLQHVSRLLDGVPVPAAGAGKGFFEPGGCKAIWNTGQPCNLLFLAQVAERLLLHVFHALRRALRQRPQRLVVRVCSLAELLPQVVLCGLILQGIHLAPNLHATISDKSSFSAIKCFLAHRRPWRKS